MASRRRPRLAPVAAPTDPFETPGVAGPAPTNFDFGAFAGLSQTLKQAAEINYRADERNKRKATETYAKSGPAIKNVLDNRVLPSPRLSFLFNDDEVTDENIQALKDNGIEGADNPYLVLMLREQMGRRVVREGDYEGHMTDPDFVGRMSQLRAEGDEKAAEGLYEKRQAEWTAKHAMGVSGIMRPAYASEVASVDSRLRTQYRAAHHKAVKEHRQIQLASQITEIAKSVVRGLTSKDTEERDQKVAESAEWIDTAVKVGGDRRGVMTALMTSIQTTAEQLVLDEGLGAAQEFVSVMEDQHGSPVTDQKFIDIGGVITRLNRTKTNSDSETVASARRIWQARVLKGRKGASVSEYFGVEGPAYQLGIEVAKESGLDPEQLLGYLRDLQRAAVQNDVMQSPVSDPDTLKRLKTLAVTTDDPALFEAAIEVARNAGTLTPEDELDVEVMHQKSTTNGRLNPEVKATKAATLANTWKPLGGLVQTEEQFKDAGAITKIYNDTFEANYKGPETAQEAASKAQAAVWASDEYKKMDAHRISLTATHWVDPKQSNVLMQDLLDEERARVQEELSEGEGVGDRQTIRSAGLERIRQLRKHYRRVVKEVIKTPKFRNAADDVERQEIISEAVYTQWGPMQEDAKLSKDPVSKQGSRDNQIGRMDRLSSLPFPTESIKQMTGQDLKRSEVWLWESYSAYQVANQSSRVYLNSVSSGTEIDWEHYARAQGAREWLTLSAVAKLRGQTPREGDHKQDRMLRTLTTTGAARDILRGQVYLQGLTSKNLNSGQFYGVPLKEILGPKWRTEFPMSQIALAWDKEELESYEKSGELKSIMTTLGFNYDDSQQRDQFVEYQKDLVRRRTMGIPGYLKSSLRRRDGFKARPELDAPWMKSLKETLK